MKIRKKKGGKRRDLACNLDQKKDTGGGEEEGSRVLIRVLCI